jgi:hypothetical protein
MNDGIMPLTSPSCRNSLSSEQDSSHKSLLTPNELAEMQDWLTHLPIQDEQIRAQIAHSLNTLQRSQHFA